MRSDQPVRAGDLPASALVMSADVDPRSLLPAPRGAYAYQQGCCGAYQRPMFAPGGPGPGGGPDEGSAAGSRDDGGSAGQQMPPGPMYQQYSGRWPQPFMGGPVSVTNMSPPSGGAAGMMSWPWGGMGGGNNAGGLAPVINNNINIVGAGGQAEDAPAPVARTGNGGNGTISGKTTVKATPPPPVAPSVEKVKAAPAVEKGKAAASVNVTGVKTVGVKEAGEGDDSDDNWWEHAVSEATHDSDDSSGSEVALPKSKESPPAEIKSVVIKVPKAALEGREADVKLNLNRETDADLARETNKPAE